MGRLIAWVYRKALNTIGPTPTQEELDAYIDQVLRDMHLR